jgi:hypothetical protein
MQSARSIYTRIFKLTKAVSISLGVALFGLALLDLPASALTVQGTYTNMSWAYPVNGYSTMNHQLTVEAVTQDAPYFWAHQFGIVSGEGGYIGLQSGGYRKNGTIGKSAVFSIFGAGIEGTAEACNVEQADFDGGPGAGTSCIIPFEWVLGHKYDLKIVKGATTSNGIVWTGTIVDTVTSEETKIADIKVPLTWKGMGDASYLWSEYFGPTITDCTTQPYSKVRYGIPLADTTIKPSTVTNTLPSNTDCKGARHSNIGSLGAFPTSAFSVIQEMGVASNATLPDPVPQPPANTTDPSTPILTPKTGILGSAIVLLVAVSLSGVYAVYLKKHSKERAEKNSEK